MMTDKVYQHTALFFEKNFTRDRMPNYKDHIDAESKRNSSDDIKNVSSLHTRPAQSCTSFNISDNGFKSEEMLPFCNPSASLFYPPAAAFPFPAAAAGLKMPALKLSTPNNKNRKRKHNSSQNMSTGSPSQSRRFYKCLGCGAAKRWDRLTDHYRKVIMIDVLFTLIMSISPFYLFQYVLFGSLGQPLPPTLDTMTPEQYVHTLAFTEHGFSVDRMPQYRDHVEANNDNNEVAEEDITTAEDTTNSSNGTDVTLSLFPANITSSPSQPNMEHFWENKQFADCKIICKDGEEIMTHRLILAAHNEYLYQLLVSCAAGDLDTGDPAVIMMPDHSSQDIVNMLQQLYNFKVSWKSWMNN